MRFRRAGKLLIAVMAVAIGLGLAPAAFAEPWSGGELSLDRALALALERNLGYATVELSAQASESATRQARDKLAPQVSVGGTYDRYVADAGDGPKVTLTVEQAYPGLLPLASLPDFPLPLTPVELARLGEDQARARAEKTRTDLVFNVTQAYYNVLKAARMREVQEAALVSAESARKVTEAKVNAGTATRVDLLRAEMDVANAELAVAKAKDGYATAESALFALLRLDLPAKTVAYAPVPGAEAPAGTLEALTAQALQKRPEVVDAALGLKRAVAQENQANFDTLPSFNLTGSLTGDRYALTSGWNPLSGTVSWTASASNHELGSAGGLAGARSASTGDEWNVGISVSYPLFDAGALREAALQARLQTAQAQNNLEQMKNTISSEVQAAWFELQEAKLSVEAARKAVNLNAEAQRLTRLRVENGVGTPSELSEANATYLEAQVNLVQAEFAEQIAIAKVKKVAGLLLGGAR